MELLKKHRVNLDASDSMGIRPLHISAIFGDSTTVQWFLNQHGVDFNKTCAEDNSVIFYTARARHEHILQLLLMSPHMHEDVKDRLCHSILHLLISWASSKLFDKILQTESVELNFTKISLD